MPVFDGPAYTNLILTAASSILALVVAVFAWYHRRITGALHLAMLSSLGFVWGLMYLLELLARSSEYKLYFDDLQFIPASFLGPVFFVLAMVFAGHSAMVRRPVWTLLYVIPTLTIIIVATNHFHQLFRRVPVTGSNTEDWLLPAQPIHGPWFWVIVASSVALIVAAAAILLYTYLHSPRWSRGRVVILLLSAIVMTGAVAL